MAAKTVFDKMRLEIDLNSGLQAIDMERPEVV